MDKQAEFIDVSDLRLGHYIYLDRGWLGHPFAVNNFRLSSLDQIETIRQLGIERIRYSPAQSVFADEQTRSDSVVNAVAGSDVPATTVDEALSAREVAGMERQKRRLQLAEQRSRLQYCENQFNDAARGYKQIMESVLAEPDVARNRSVTLIDGVIEQLGDATDETYIRLLSEKSADKSSLHSINVSILSLLLGKAMRCDADQMQDIGVGALLHDLGKIEIPDRFRWNNDQFNPSEFRLYCEHVAKGVALVNRIGIAKGAQLVVAQHHEYASGTGFPQRLSGEQISIPSRIVALVNHYDNLCNPANPGLAVTPHEALSQIFAKSKSKFDSQVLAAFIRLMGVYPPGSVVELSDERFAIVVSVSSQRPLRPNVVIYTREIPAEEALIVDLETQPELSIRRSIKPVQLPKAIFDYLSPRTRLCYYFECNREVDEAVV